MVQPLTVSIVIASLVLAVIAAIRGLGRRSHQQATADCLSALDTVLLHRIHTNGGDPAQGIDQLEATVVDLLAAESTVLFLDAPSNHDSTAVGHAVRDVLRTGILSRDPLVVPVRDGQRHTIAALVVIGARRPMTPFMEAALELVVSGGDATLAGEVTRPMVGSPLSSMRPGDGLAIITIAGLADLARQDHSTAASLRDAAHLRLLETLGDRGEISVDRDRFAIVVRALRRPLAPTLQELVDAVGELGHGCAARAGGVLHTDFRTAVSSYDEACRLAATALDTTSMVCVEGVPRP